MELPFGEMDLDLYNIIRDWAIECDTELSVNVKSSEHKIHIYTTRPGILIGPRGTLVNKYLYALHQHPRWKEYDFTINKVTMVITPYSPYITQEQYEKSLIAHVEDIFSNDDIGEAE